MEKEKCEVREERTLCVVVVDICWPLVGPMGQLHPSCDGYMTRAYTFLYSDSVMVVVSLLCRTLWIGTSHRLLPLEGSSLSLKFKPACMLIPTCIYVPSSLIST